MTLSSRIGLLAGAFIAAGLLTGCPPANQVVLPGPGGSAGSQLLRLYVANFSFSSPTPSPGISVFQGPFSSGTTQLGLIPEPPSSPGAALSGVAVDPTDSTRVYGIHTKLGVLAYARPNPNGGAPLFSILGTMSTPISGSFDGGGNIFVADLGNNVYEITHPITSGSLPVLLPLTGLTLPTEVAADPSSNLYVLDVPSPAPSASPHVVLREYGPSHAGAPLASTSNGLTTIGVEGVTGIAFDPVNNQVFVANSVNSGTETIVGYATPITNNESPTTTINVGTNLPVGIAFDASGNLYAFEFVSPGINQLSVFLAPLSSSSVQAFAFPDMPGAIGLELAIGH